MIMPSVEQMAGVQSANVTCTGTGSNGLLGSSMGFACEERMVASRKNHQPMANCMSCASHGGRSRQRPAAADYMKSSEVTHEGAREIDEDLTLARAQRDLGQVDEAHSPGVARPHWDVRRRHCCRSKTL